MRLLLQLDLEALAARVPRFGRDHLQPHLVRVRVRVRVRVTPTRSP